MKDTNWKEILIFTNWPIKWMALLFPFSFPCIHILSHVTLWFFLLETEYISLYLKTWLVLDLVVWFALPVEMWAEEAESLFEAYMLRCTVFPTVLFVVGMGKTWFWSPPHPRKMRNPWSRSGVQLGVSQRGPSWPTPSQPENVQDIILFLCHRILG